MQSPFDNVKDSSIWYKPSALKTVNSLDTRLYIGVVREALNNTDTNELHYLVEIYHKNDIILSNCRMLRRWGGVYNYEDYVMHGYNYNAASNNQNGNTAIPGDVVLVGQFAGQGREGVIIGSLTHPARKNFLDTKKGPQYKSEFNGIETSINEDGEWTLTFKGQPTNKDNLDSAPDQVVPAPEYDKDVGTSYLKWDKTGSFTIDDNATDGDKIQRLFIDKKNGTINIDSGKISLKFTKKDQSVVLNCKTSENNSEDSITYKTKKFKGDATDRAHVTTPLYVVESGKVRLGSEGASQQLVNGNLYRTAETTKHSSEQSGIATELSGTALISAVGAQLAAAGAMMAIPVAGAVMAAPIIAAAGAQLTAAAAALTAGLTTINVAITTFEGQTATYLSKISKTDP